MNYSKDTKSKIKKGSKKPEAKMLAIALSEAKSKGFKPTTKK